MKQQPKKQFHTIDALRFLAFLKVFFLHIPTDTDFGWFSYLKKGGGIGVAFFFVLSGFLITYLLVNEKLIHTNINLFRFYSRRIFRIWPLFFLFLLLLYVPTNSFMQKVGLYQANGYMPDWRISFAFLENYKIIFERNSPAIGPLGIAWSLCIEEHFYFIWGIIALLCPLNKMPFALIGLILFSIITRFFAIHFLPDFDIATNEIFTSFDYFATGGLLGYFLARNPEGVESKILNIPLFVRWIGLFLSVIFVFFHDAIFGWLFVPKIIVPFINAIIFTYTIAIVIPQKSSIRIEENNPLTYLGKISYGMYLFHIAFILMALKFCNIYSIRIDSAKVLTLFIVFTFICTVLLSSLLYKYFERPFLRLKNRMSIVSESGK
jgi:peptidoglycan/LPS O-acetylase OafA/YrhL